MVNSEWQKPICFSPFTIHTSPFTLQNSPFTIHHSPFLLCLPRHWHEGDRPHLLDGQLSPFPGRHGQGLGEGGAPERENQPPTFLQLPDEWGRDVVRRGGDDDRVVRGVLLPAEV